MFNPIEILKRVTVVCTDCRNAYRPTEKELISDSRCEFCGEDTLRRYPSIEFDTDKCCWIDKSNGNVVDIKYL